MSMQEGENNYLEPEINIAPETGSEKLHLSFRDLISATIEPGDGALSRLWSHLSLLPMEQSQEIYELLMDLELRIRRYLITEENSGKKKQQPTMYATLLVDAVNSEESISEKSQCALVELSSVVIAEIGPILRRIHAIIAEIAPSLAQMQAIQELSTNEGLLNALAQGSAGRADVPSFFGVLQSLKGKIKNFPPLDLTEINIPPKLIVEDPLGIDTVEYFKERQNIFASIYDRKISLPQLLASRSLSTTYELDLAKQHIVKSVKRDAAQLKNLEDDAQREKMQIEIDGKRDLRRAYDTLAQWVTTEAESLDGMSDTSFQSHVASLTFAWGDPEEITDILNSLEVVKHDNPELYARMLGIQAQVSSSEAQRSDLFGNALHIAFHRSLHARTRSDIQGSQFFHDRMAKLTELDATQDALVHINERQWQKLEKLLVPQASGIAQGSVTELWKAKQYAEFFQSYQLRKMLEAADIERREELLQRFRGATPKEFISLVKKLPRHGQDMLRDLALVDIFRERGLIQVARSHSSEIGQVVMTRPSDVNLVRCVLEYITSGRKTTRFGESPNDVVIDFGKETDVELNASLWKTTPSEKLLESGEFVKFLVSTTNTVHAAHSDLKRLIGNNWNQPPTLSEHQRLKEDALSRMDNALSDLCSILSAHPDITKVQWLDWYIRNLYVRYKTPFAVNSTAERPKFANMVKGLFSEFHPQHVIQNPSGFFALAERLFPLKYSFGNSPLLTHFPRLQNNNPELLTIDKELREPHVKLLVQYRTTDTKEFLKQHREEFVKVDIDIFFSILTPQEQIDLLITVFDKSTGYFKPFWGSNDFRPTLNSLPWRIELLNYAEQLIPENENYRKIVDIEWQENDRQYRCAKNVIGDKEKPVSQWQMEWRNRSSLSWEPLLKNSEDL